MKLSYSSGLLAALLITWIAFAVQTASSGAGNPVPPRPGFGYCTDYAAQQFHAPSSQMWAGDAKDWVTNAGRKGWNTSNNIKAAVPGSLVVWQGGGYGHVAYVNSKTPTGINITEMNWATTNLGKSHIYGPKETSAQFYQRTYWSMTDNFDYNPGTIFLAFSTGLMRGSSKSPYTFSGYILPSRH